MTNREIILGRIREALKISAPHPAFSEKAQIPSPPNLFQSSFQKWLPPVGETSDEQIELFRQNSENLKTDFRVCADVNEAVQYVKTLAVENHWGKIGTHHGELTNAVARELNLPKVQTDSGYAIADLESCDAGLTECESLIAQTGSVLVSAHSAGGRALSVLPPHHIVLARKNQMTPNLSIALQRAREKFGDTFPSFLSFITGPSRTGDIERILVLGAHGPKKLTILILP
ncbi:MAG TPA: lactate utilization protein [Verrucomicrobiae bacterium]|nr:lactate utilization protein [Verrucomicrobiae bacterium]